MLIVPASPCAPETFWFLLHDKAHWEFEMFLMVVFDGLVGAMLWPFVKKHWDHHIARDKKEETGTGDPLIPGRVYEVVIDGVSHELTILMAPIEKEEAMP